MIVNRFSRRRLFASLTGVAAFLLARKVGVADAPADDPAHEPRAATTTYTFDEFGRLLSVSYPDRHRPRRLAS